MSAPLSKRGESPTVLLVEPNPDDADLLLEPLHEIPGSTHLVDTGNEALDFLHNHGDYSDSPHPNLIILSTGLPTDTTVTDVLRETVETETLRRTPIVVLSQDGDEKNVRRAYELRVNAYVKKPTESADFRDTAETITDFWIRVNELPTSRDEDEGERLS